MRVAYVTSESCGQGHAVRGVALGQAAARAGVTYAAFGPPDWREAAEAWAPDLLLGDVGWRRLEPLRRRLGVPAWLLLRWVPDDWLAGIAGWDRVIAIEPAADGIPGVTHHVQPVITDPVPPPEAGTVLSAGYNAYWQAQRGGWDVRWRDDGRPERAARIGTTSERYDGGAMLMRAIAGPRVWVFDPALRGRDYKVDDHGFRLV